MLTDRMSRRRMLLGAGGAAAAAGAGLAFGAAPAGANAVMPSHRHSHDILGTWVITHTDNPSAATPSPEPGMSTGSFVAGGIFLIHDFNPPGPPGQGSWASTDDGGFNFSFVSGGNQPGSPGAQPATYVLTVTGTGTVSDGSMSGTYTFKVTDGKTSATLDNGTGSFTATPYSATG